MTEAELPISKQSNRKDFFVSYTHVDLPWAEWVTWQLESAGYSTVLQAWDFRPGSNFVLKMDEAAQEADRTIAILSPDYLDAPFAKAEWASAFQRDPTGELGTLLPVQVRDCSHQFIGLMGAIININLVGLEEKVAKEHLLKGITRERAKPISQPKFPTFSYTSKKKQPPYPGLSLVKMKSGEFSRSPIAKRKRTYVQRASIYISSVVVFFVLFAFVSQSMLVSYVDLNVLHIKPVVTQTNNPTSLLGMSLDAIQSKFWVIPGDPNSYTLNKLPPMHTGAIHIDGHTSAPFYYLYFEMHSLVEGQASILIKEVRLEVKHIYPMPHPVRLWTNVKGTSYESLHKYQALYLGQESGTLLAEYISPDYITHNLGFVTLRPGETDTIEVHVISRTEADLSFSIAIKYTVGIDPQIRDFNFPTLFEIMFVNQSDWRQYQLQSGHFVI